MTPELIELARAAMALPGWRFPRPDGQLRDKHGIRWVASDPLDFQRGGSGHPVPDLADPATGGVLVTMLGFEARRVRATASMREYAAGFPWCAEAELRLPMASCRYQAEAACRVAVDIGGWK